MAVFALHWVRLAARNFRTALRPAVVCAAGVLLNYDIVLAFKPMGGYQLKKRE